MRLSFYQRYARPILWLTLLVLPFAVFGATQAVKLTKNRIIDWLPASFDETQKLLWFNDRFGSDEILAISWPACTLENTEVDQFVAALKAKDPFRRDDSSDPIFHEVISGQTVFAEMTSAPLSLPPALAKERMQGWLLGHDLRTTCVIARISPNPDGSFSREEAVDFVRQTATAMAGSLGIQATELKIAGPTADSAAINIAGAENINTMRIAAVVLGLGLAWLGLRDLLQVSNVFATALLATLISLASVYFCGQYMDAILLPLPALVFVLTVSGAVHLTHYYADAVREHDLRLAPGLAMKAGGMPCALAGITTMIGLASLSVSNVVPVRRFGLLASLGVGLGLICLLLVWPALTQRFQRTKNGTPRDGKGGFAAKTTKVSRQGIGSQLVATCLLAGHASPLGDLVDHDLRDARARRRFVTNQHLGQSIQPPARREFSIAKLRLDQRNDWPARSCRSRSGIPDSIDGRCPFNI